MNWQEIRFGAGTFYGADIVVLIHPWKGRWAIVFAEDMYGLSEVLAAGLSVKEAKLVAKALIPYLNERFDGGDSVKYLKAGETQPIVRAVLDRLEQIERDTNKVRDLLKNQDPQWVLDAINWSWWRDQPPLFVQEDEEGSWFFKHGQWEAMLKDWKWSSEAEVTGSDGEPIFVFSTEAHKLPSEDSDDYDKFVVVVRYVLPRGVGIGTETQDKKIVWMGFQTAEGLKREIEGGVVLPDFSENIP